MQTRQLSDASILEAIADEWGERLDHFTYAQKTEALVVLSHLIHNGDLADVQSHSLPRKFLIIVSQLSRTGELGLMTAIAHQLRDGGK